MLKQGQASLLYRIVANDVPRYAKTYVWAFVMMAIVAGATTMTAWLMKDIINKVFVEKNSELLWLIGLTVLAVFSAKGAAGYGQEYLLSRAGNRIVADYQRRIMNHTLYQDMRFFDRVSSSDLINRMTTATQSVRSAINLIAVSLGRDLLTLIGLVGMMVSLDPVLCLSALIVSPIALYGVGSLGKQVRKIAQKELMAFTYLITGVRESVQGAQVIKAYNLEERQSGAMDQAIARVQDRANRIASLSSATNPLMEVLAGIAISSVIVYSGSQVIAGTRDPGSFFAFITALLLAYEPAKRLARLHIQLGNSLIGAQLLFEILDRPLAEAPRPGDREVHFSRGHIVFDRVSFAYDPEKPVAQSISLEMPGGKVTALIGPSGSGKTTLTRLIPRLYEISDGSITIDGTNINEIGLHCLRSQIAIVSQDVFMFEGTIRSNIAIGREDASDAEIEAAARAALAHDFIVQMPNGYDTLLGEQGHNLSGGQRQRISIARAFLKNAKIVLLDEATSALDSHTEHQIRLALEELAKGRTVVMIAHRLSTIVRADRIYVIVDGRVIDSGTHEELVSREGHYKSAFGLQVSVS